MTRQTIEVHGKALEVACWGSGSAAPILLLHEGLGSVGLWKGFPERLADASGREVIAWSRLGHGWSDARDTLQAFDYMHREADLLPAVHAALGLTRAHWLGHSDGGSIALIGAARQPSLAASLILEAPHVFVEDLTVSSIAEFMQALPGSNIPERMQRYHREPLPMLTGWGNAWLSPEFRDWNIEELLPGVAAPALLLQGRDDQYGTAEQLERIAAVLPDTQSLLLDHCGHSPHHEQGAAVTEAICRFLEGRE